MLRSREEEVERPIFWPRICSDDKRANGLVRQVTEMHKSGVGVDSAAGAGTEFTLGFRTQRIEGHPPFSEPGERRWDT